MKFIKYSIIVLVIVIALGLDASMHYMPEDIERPYFYYVILLVFRITKFMVYDAVFTILEGFLILFTFKIYIQQYLRVTYYRLFTVMN